MAQPTAPPAHQLRSPRSGDVDPSGDLVEHGAFVLWGWRTVLEEEEATRIVVDSPSEAGEALAGLLRSGHVHFTMSKLDRDGRVAFPPSE